MLFKKDILKRHLNVLFKKNNLNALVNKNLFFLPSTLAKQALGMHPWDRSDAVTKKGDIFKADESGQMGRLF